MTEVPEHLLKRSRERRAAMGGGGADDDAAAAPGPDASTATPATTEEAAAPAPAAAAAAAAPAVPEPEPAKPAPVYVQAYEQRRRIPWWAMSVLAFLPVWAYVYQGTLEPPPAGENDPLVLGQAEYAPCASCHGGSGGGGVGPALNGGAVLETFPDYRDHMMWVRVGGPGWPSATYGATDKANNGNMPPFENLTDQQLAQVVLYERQGLSGEEPDPNLLAIAAGEMTFAEAGLGPESEEAGLDPPAEEGAG